MYKKFIVVLVGLLMVFSVVACKKKEERPIPSSVSMQPGVMMPQGETQIVVPEFVQGKWGGVKLIVEDKSAGSQSDVAINLGEEYTIPGTELKVKVNEFLPDFVMDGLTITSKSEELNNPAVNIVVTEGGSEVFDGWLYSKFPAIHPFQHDKYGITLKEAVEKG
jgi:hypothetical protein